MLLKNLSKKVLLTHADCPERIIGYDTKFIENGTPFASEVIVVLAHEGDYATLLRVYNSGCKTYFKVAGRESITEYTGEFLPELEQFCRTKHKTEMTLDKAKRWFTKNAFRFEKTANIIDLILNECKDTEELEDVYRNICTALLFDPKTFRLHEDTIDDFNSRTAYTNHDRQDRIYASNDIRASYNWKGEYEEHPVTDTKFERNYSSYSSTCKKTYSIISEIELCTILAYAEYIDSFELPEDVYKCECGSYIRYLTANVEWDENQGRFRSYPDVDCCCSHCGNLRITK